MDARLMKIRATKAVRLLPRRQLWPLVRHGVVPSLEHMSVPFDLGYRTVVDVGASYGQFASFAAYQFPNARIISFEPLTEARQTIDRLLGSRVETRPYALGASAGPATFHVAENNDSSSLLAPSRVQIQEFPGTATVAERTVEVRTLADELPPAEIVAPALLKIDVQGAELDVLRGAGDLVSAFADAFVECSFAELYEGQALAAGVIACMDDRGFGITSITGQALGVGGELLQADLLFRRRTLS